MAHRDIVATGGLAINAQLNVPAYICLDGSGSLYISDGQTYTTWGGNNTIRKVSLTTGIITTVAGTGTAGFSGDGGLATAAELNGPTEIVCDPAGNVYVADNGNNVIRKINKQTGIITTIAGGGQTLGDGDLGTNTMLMGPIGLAISRSGDIFFSDMYGMRIKKLKQGTGIITTIAGAGSHFMEAHPAVDVRVGTIYGMYCDGHGDVYINDESCSCRRIDSSDANIYKVAGDTMMEGYNGDSGPAHTTWFNRPIGMEVNPLTGDVIVADMFNSRVRMVTQSGYISTLPEPEPEEPQGVANINNQGKMLVYPNPSAGKLIIERSVGVEAAKIEVYNTIGALVCSVETKEQRTVVNLSQQPAGIYQVVVNSTSGRTMQKVVIAK